MNLDEIRNHPWAQAGVVVAGVIGFGLLTSHYRKQNKPMREKRGKISSDMDIVQKYERALAKADRALKPRRIVGRLQWAPRELTEIEKAELRAKKKAAEDALVRARSAQEFMTTPQLLRFKRLEKLAIPQSVHKLLEGPAQPSPQSDLAQKFWNIRGELMKKHNGDRAKVTAELKQSHMGLIHEIRDKDRRSYAKIVGKSPELKG